MGQIGLLCFCFVAMGTKELRGPGIPTFAICGTSLPPAPLSNGDGDITRETLFLENGATEGEEEEEEKEGRKEYRLHGWGAQKDPHSGF